MQEKSKNIAPIKERIFQYLESEGVKKSEFYTKSSLSPGLFKNVGLKSELGSDKIAKILDSFPNLNPEWLLTGEGSMFKKPDNKSKFFFLFDNEEREKKNSPEENIENSEPIVHVGSTGNKYTEMESGKFRVSVPLVPAHAYARYISDFQDVEFKEDFEYVEFIVDIVGKGKYYAFEIKGDSMDDDSKRSIPDRSTVLARDLMKEHWKNKLNFRRFPFWIIVHQNNIMCKEIIGHDVERGIIKCHSLNDSPEYTDFEVDLREVKQLLNIVKIQQDMSF